MKLTREKAIDILRECAEACKEVVSGKAKIAPSTVFIIGEKDGEDGILIHSMESNFELGKELFFKAIGVVSSKDNNIVPVALIVQAEAWAVSFDTKEDAEEFKNSGNRVSETVGSSEIMDFTLSLEDGYRYSIAYDILRDTDGNIVFGDKMESDTLESKFGDIFFESVRVTRRLMNARK